MTMNEDALRARFTYAMAQSVDEADTYEEYFGEPSSQADYGVARADGSLPANMVFIWEFAGYITNCISIQGIDVLDLLNKVGELFVTYKAIKSFDHDFEPSDMDKMKEAVSSVLLEIAQKKQ